MEITVNEVLTKTFFVAGKCNVLLSDEIKKLKEISYHCFTLITSLNKRTKEDLKTIILFYTCGSVLF